jgi:hypothetical protein
VSVVTLCDENVPPFPASESKVLELVLDDARSNLDEGMDQWAVIVHAVVLAWMEGDLEGHDCPGEEDEPGNVKLRRALREGRTLLTHEQAVEIARQRGVAVPHLVQEHNLFLVSRTADLIDSG